MAFVQISPALWHPTDLHSGLTFPPLCRALHPKPLSVASPSLPQHIQHNHSSAPFLFIQLSAHMLILKNQLIFFKWINNKCYTDTQHSVSERVGTRSKPWLRHTPQHRFYFPLLTGHPNFCLVQGQAHSPS